MCQCYYLGMRTAGFVLVGGRSTRMGTDKALLPWRDTTLVHDIAMKVREAAGNVVLVGNPGMYDATGIDSVADLHPGFGPLSGVEAALASGRGDLNLIVACDLPLLETEWLKRLLETARSRDVKCLVASDSDGRVHPLCGVYRHDCLKVVQNAVHASRLRVMETIEELAAETLSIDAPLWNVNTPVDWQKCQELANGG